MDQEDARQLARDVIDDLEQSAMYVKEYEDCFAYIHNGITLQDALTAAQRAVQVIQYLSDKWEQDHGRKTD